MRRFLIIFVVILFPALVVAGAIDARGNTVHMPVDEITGMPCCDPPPPPRPIPPPVPEKDWEETADTKPMTGQQAFEHRIWKLLQVYNNDISSNCHESGSVKINMSARKKYFTDNGWLEYQKYIEEMKSLRVVDHPVYAVSGIFDTKSKKYSQWFGKYSGFSVEGNLQRWISCDEVGFGPKFSLSLGFSRTASVDPKNILINTWLVKADYPPAPKVSPYLYKSKSPFWVFTCTNFGLACN
jgi:hypothetical protein